MRRPLLLAGLLVLGSAATGCLSRTLPILPPGATVYSETCEPDTCPGGGRIITIRGIAASGAFVVAENLSRSRPDGMHFVASTTATTQADVSAGRATVVGSYEICLCPRPDGAGGVLISQPGDRLIVYQYVETSEGIARSDALELSVPAP